MPGTEVAPWAVNSLMTGPLVMTTDDAVRTLPLGVALLREQGSGVRWNVLLAANVLLSLPAIALYVVAQRHLIDAATQPAHRDR